GVGAVALGEAPGCGHLSLRAGPNQQWVNPTGARAPAPGATQPENPAPAAPEKTACRAVGSVAVSAGPAATGVHGDEDPVPDGDNQRDNADDDACDRQTTATLTRFGDPAAGGGPPPAPRRRDPGRQRPNRP